AAANDGLDVARANKTRVQNETLANVVRTFYAHNAAKQFLELVDEGERSLNEALRTGTEMVKRNSEQVTDNDLFMLRSLLCSLLARRAEPRRGLESSRELMVFLSRPGPEDPRVMETLNPAVPAEPPPPVVTFEAAGREHRPELRMADKALSARKEVAWI